MGKEGRNNVIKITPGQGRGVLTVGSLFSGIGGLDLGLERAGMEVIWQVEWDDYASKVLAKHWPGIARYRDIRDVDFRELPRPDLICGGFPCQPISSVGKRKGDEDERWLWPEFYRAIRETQPQWVLVENVPGLLSIQTGRLFGGILRDLAQSGYDAEWCLLPSGYKFKHFRWRLFLLAYTKGNRLVPPEIFTRSNIEGDFRRTCEFNTIPNFKEAWGISDSHHVRRVNGIHPWMDRISGCGNAVVPQVAEWIGRRIMEVENAETP